MEIKKCSTQKRGFQTRRSSALHQDRKPAENMRSVWLQSEIAHEMGRAIS